MHATGPWVSGLRDLRPEDDERPVVEAQRCRGRVRPPLDLDGVVPGGERLARAGDRVGLPGRVSLVEIVRRVEREVITDRRIELVAVDGDADTAEAARSAAEAR